MSPKLMPMVKCATASPPSLLREASAQWSPRVQALRLAMWRIDASVADIASWCEVHRSTAERWVSGKSEPSLKALTRSRRLYPVFSDCLDELLDGKRAA